MISDDERRKVARRLREIRPCKSGHIKWWEIARALGLKQPAGWFGWEKFEPDSVNRLADLIEPSGHGCVPGECPLNVCHDNDRIDRDALLALAKVLHDMGNQYNAHKRYELGMTFRLIAACIREALGVNDA